MYTHTSSPSRRMFSKEAFSKAIHSFSKMEWYAFLALLGVMLVSALLLLNRANNALLVEVPLRSGKISEGIIGTPRFVNPVLAVTDSEKDITALIYSGLMKKTSDGAIVPDLATTYEVSADGLTYTFAIKDDAVFHNNAQVESKDVVYTIKQIQNAAIKSPKKINWEGVTVNAIDTKHVAFTLKQPYSGFLENTTLGILPQDVWKDIPDDEFSFSDLNTKGIGSGPYVISKVNKKSTGVPDSYELKSFEKYVGTQPYIPDIHLSFYANEKDIVDAYKKGNIDQLSALSPDQAKILEDKGAHIEEASLSRIFGLFFNQSQAPIFTDKTVVKALDLAIDKQSIVDTILGGYGEAIDGPIPPNMLEGEPAVAFPHGDKVAAAEMLAKAGWVKDENGVLVKTTRSIIKPATKGKNAKPAETRESSARLSFTITTGDAPELRRAAEMIQTDLQSIGAEVEVKVFETGNLNQNVIRPRSYDALFFGQVISRESDFFAFWHSSQRNDPGLNVALYANTRVDSILEDALTEPDQAARNEDYKQFEAEITKDMPAIFVYSPHFIYIVDKHLSGFHFDRFTAPFERFLTITDWYVDTDSVWNIFAPKE